MKLYKYTFGDWERYGPAIDDTDAYERRETIDPQFHYVPVTIEEVKLEGYEISVSKAFDDNGGLIAGAVIPYRKNQEYLLHLGREELKELLRSKNVEFTPQWGEQKLRELAIQHT